MENKEVITSAENVGEQKKRYGRILNAENGFFFTVSICNGDFVTEDGKSIEFELLQSATTSAPMIRFKGKTFVLDWGDIIELAEQAGLFKGEVTA